MMSRARTAAVLIHTLTASGSICGLLALHFVALRDWQSTFLCLGVALIIDGIDGPLARKLDVKAVLPRFSGAGLDHIVDYLNYCVVPAFILMQSDIIEGMPGVAMAVVILMVSLFHFADAQSKTADGYFVGFPAIWNVACLYLFVFDLKQGAAAAILLVLAALIFVPIKWVHPFRAHRLHAVTFAVVAGWSIAAIHAVVSGFPGNTVVRVVFLGAAVYLIGIGVLRTLRAKNRAEP